MMLKESVRPVGAVRDPRHARPGRFSKTFPEYAALRFREVDGRAPTLPDLPGRKTKKNLDGTIIAISH